MRKSLLEKEGAGDETRTRDINLGKVALYQLSYTRVFGKVGKLTKLRGGFKSFPEKGPAANAIFPMKFYCPSPRPLAGFLLKEIRFVSIQT